MKNNLRNWMGVFFSILGIVHISQLIRWYNIVMADYLPMKTNVEKLYQETLKEILLTTEHCLDGNNKDNSYVICSECENKLNSAISNKDLSAHIYYHNNMPIYMQIGWSSDVGLIKRKYTNISLQKDFEKICSQKQ